jgi:hypothetical protein
MAADCAVLSNAAAFAIEFLDQSLAPQSPSMRRS